METKELVVPLNGGFWKALLVQAAVSQACVLCECFFIGIRI